MSKKVLLTFHKLFKLHNIMYNYMYVVHTSGQQRELEGQGKIYVVTALIEYLNVLLEYIDFWGP